MSALAYEFSKDEEEEEEVKVGGGERERERGGESSRGHQLNFKGLFDGFRCCCHCEILISQRYMSVVYYLVRRAVSYCMPKPVFVRDRGVIKYVSFAKP